MNYDANFFIEFFDKIPEKKWCTHTQDNRRGQHCAYGHLYSEENPEAYYEFSNFDKKHLEEGKDLTFINDDYYQQRYALADINNGCYKEYQQPTPKQRVLAALYDIRDGENAIKQTQQIANQSKIEEYATV